MKRLCHQYSHQYYRRGSTSQPNASTSRDNRVRTILEERPAFKFFAAHRNSEFPDHIGILSEVPKHGHAHFSVGMRGRFAMTCSLVMLLNVIRCLKILSLYVMWILIIK